MQTIIIHADRKGEEGIFDVFCEFFLEFFWALYGSVCVCVKSESVR